MTRKSFLTSLIILVALAAAVGTALFTVLRHEPEAYAQAELPPGPEREAVSAQFEEKAVNLVNEIQCEAEWHGEFTEEQINSYLAEDFLKSPPIRLPGEIRDPRVVLRPGKLIVGFRYGEGELSTVISLEAKIWLPRREPNLIAIEIEELRAGAMPIAVKSLRQQIDEEARKHNIDVHWYRNEGNPVAVLRLQADKREPTHVVSDIEIRQGVIAVKGKTLERGVPLPPATATNQTVASDPSP